MPLLSAIELAASNRKSQEQLLPARGVKQYAPSNSWLESKQIQSAVEEKKSILQAERIEKWSSRACATWLPDKKVAEVTRKVGKHFQTMGCEKGGKLILQPEEALYLMETNILELEYGEVAMSIQQAYALLLGPQCTLAEYRTYSKLQRLGLVVKRHSEFPPLRETQTSGIKRQHEPENEIIPAKKKAANITSPIKKNEPKIELIDLEDDEPSGFELYVPDILGKDNVCVKIPPHDLLPDNSRPRCLQYVIKPRNLQQPGQGARPLPPQRFTSNYYQGQPWQYNRPIFNQVINPLIQRYIGMNLSNSVYPRFMQRNTNFNTRFPPFHQFLRANFNNRMNFNFPFVPRMNTTLNTTQTTQFFANTVANHQFLSIGRTVIQQTSHQISYPPPLLSNFQVPRQQVPPVPRLQNNNENLQDTNLTPPPNPIVPRLKAKSWAEVKAKLASTVEIITLDEDDGSELSISPDKPLLQPEDCSSLGSIMSKLQIFKKSQCNEQADKSSVLIKFDAFQSSVPFRKTEIRPPDFNIIVINHPDTLLSDADFVGNGSNIPVLYAIVQPDTINFFLLSDVNLNLPVN